MDSFNNFSEEEQRFFKRHFWTVDSCSEDENNNSSNMTVRPFLHRSRKLYWEKAYSEYLKQQTIQDKAAIAAEITMDIAYTAGNFFNSVAPAIKQLANAGPVIGIVWNLIDTAGALTLSIRDENKQDAWSQGINLLSGLQLSGGTRVFTLINYSEVLHLGINASLGVSVIAAGASGFAFAAAMYFTWALEHREVQLYHARISSLENDIHRLENTLFYKVLGKENGKVIFCKVNSNEVGNYPGPEKREEFAKYDVKIEEEKIKYLEEKIKSIQALIDVQRQESALQKYGLEKDKLQLELQDYQELWALFDFRKQQCQ